MDNETTRLINEDNAQNAQVTNKETKETPTAKKSKKGISPAAAVGGFAAGAGLGVAATASAMNTPEEDMVDTKEKETSSQDVNHREHTPESNQTETYQDPTPVVEEAKVINPGPAVENTDANMVSNDGAPVEVELIQPEPVDSEIRILGVQAVDAGDGHIMNVALVEAEGDQALLVDVDNNGSIDVLLHDDNADGYLQESEIYDVSDANIEMADIVKAQAMQGGDVYYASDDEPTDYFDNNDQMMEV